MNKLIRTYTFSEINSFIDKAPCDPGVLYLVLNQLSSDIKSNFKLMEKIIFKLITDKNIKWRHLKVMLPFYKEYYTETEFMEFYQKNIYPLIPIESKLILGISEIYPKLLDIYLNHYLVVDKYFGDTPRTTPEFNYTLLITQIEKFIKKKFSQKGLNAFLKVIPTKKYDLVFDGNNILLNKKGNIEIESFLKMNLLFESAREKGFNPIVFIHARHLKTLKRMGLKITFNYIATLYRYNDDWFSLYYAIKNNVYLVSRDIFRDHINQFDTQKGTNYLKIFLHHKKLNMTEDFSEIIFENKNIPIILKENGNYFIPGLTGYFKITT